MSEQQLVVRKPGQLTHKKAKAAKGKKGKKESSMQSALRLGSKAVYSLYSGNVPMALDVAYEGLGALGTLGSGGKGGSGVRSGSASSMPMASSVAAPTASSSLLSGSFNSSHQIVSNGRKAEDSIRVKGQIMVGTLTSGTTAYYLTAGGTDYYLSDTQGDFIISLQNSTLVSTITAASYPRVLNPPTTFVADISRAYTLWRPNALAFRYIPICPTSTAGSVTMSWRPTDVTKYTLAGSGLIYGNNPFSIQVMSQQPCFTTGPAWSGNGFALNPRKKGVCENANDWLTIDGPDEVAAGAFAGSAYNALQRSFSAGYLSLAMDGFDNTVSAVTAGYLIFEFDYTMHMHSPLKYYTTIYGLPEPQFAEHLRVLRAKYDRAKADQKDRKESAEVMQLVRYSKNDPDRPLTPVGGGHLETDGYSTFSPTDIQGRGGGRKVTMPR